MPAHAVLYSRDLPGGGFVAIDATPIELSGAGGHRARLWVERRADHTRRTGHAPPVIAQCTADDPEAAMAELRTIASDNVQLALAMRRWAQARRTGAPRP